MLGNPVNPRSQYWRKQPDCWEVLSDKFEQPGVGQVARAEHDVLGLGSADCAPLDRVAQDPLVSTEEYSAIGGGVSDPMQIFDILRGPHPVSAVDGLHIARESADAVDEPPAVRTSIPEQPQWRRFAHAASRSSRCATSVMCSTGMPKSSATSPIVSPARSMR